MTSKRKLNAHGEDFAVDPARYRAWIAYVFDRPETPNGWYFDLEDREQLDGTPSEFMALIGQTMAHAGIDLAGFTNAQVYHGLNYIFSSPCSDHLYIFRHESVPLDLKIAAIRAMKHLYKNCFEQRCDSRLSHLDEGRTNRLNGIAYMLWESPSFLYSNRHLKDVAAAAVEVLEYALYSQNDACIESALHGLGHEVRDLPALIEPVIDRFLAATRDAETPAKKGEGSLRPLREALRHYARLARRGRVQ